jgi:hypothetical protein
MTQTASFDSDASQRIDLGNPHACGLSLTEPDIFLTIPPINSALLGFFGGADGFAN